MSDKNSLSRRKFLQYSGLVTGGAAAAFTLTGIAPAAVAADADKTALYVDSCAACHKTNGSGYARFFPELRGNPVLMSKDPVSLIHITLTGQTLPGLKAAPTSMTMPPFGWRFTDQQIADVITFIRSSWGNKAPAVTVEEVRTIREDKSLLPDSRSFGSSKVEQLLKK